MAKLTDMLREERTLLIERTARAAGLLMEAATALREAEERIKQLELEKAK